MRAIDLTSVFIKMTDEQKAAVIRKLDANPATPAELLSGLRWLAALSTEQLKNQLFEEIHDNAKN